MNLLAWTRLLHENKAYGLKLEKNCTTSIFRYSHLQSCHLIPVSNHEQTLQQCFHQLDYIFYLKYNLWLGSVDGCRQFSIIGFLPGCVRLFHRKGVVLLLIKYSGEQCLDTFIYSTVLLPDQNPESKSHHTDYEQSKHIPVTICLSRDNILYFYMEM